MMIKISEFHSSTLPGIVLRRVFNKLLKEIEYCYGDEDECFPPPNYPVPALYNRGGGVAGDCMLVGGYGLSGTYVDWSCGILRFY